MNDDTIYKGLQMLYNRGQLMGKDLKEYREWESAKIERKEFNLVVNECIDGYSAIDNMVNGYKVKNL